MLQFLVLYFPQKYINHPIILLNSWKNFVLDHNNVDWHDEARLCAGDHGLSDTWWAAQHALAHTTSHTT